MPGPAEASRREVRGGLGLRRPVARGMEALLHMVRIDGEILVNGIVRDLEAGPHLRVAGAVLARLQLGNHRSASGAHCAVGGH